METTTVDEGPVSIVRRRLLAKIDGVKLNLSRDGGIHRACAQHCGLGDINTHGEEPLRREPSNDFPLPTTDIERGSRP